MNATFTAARRLYHLVQSKLYPVRSAFFNIGRVAALEKMMQINLMLHYRELLDRDPRGSLLPKLQDIGYRVYSQFDEDATFREESDVITI